MTKTEIESIENFIKKISESCRIYHDSMNELLNECSIYDSVGGIEKAGCQKIYDEFLEFTRDAFSNTNDMLRILIEIKKIVNSVDDITDEVGEKILLLVDLVTEKAEWMNTTTKTMCTKILTIRNAVNEQGIYINKSAIEQINEKMAVSSFDDFDNLVPTDKDTIH